jgi:hypothetical protein
MKQSARCHQLERIKNGIFTVPANVVVPATFLSAGKAMELVAIHQFESHRSTIQQDTTQFDHGQTSFTHSSTPTTSNPRVFTTDNNYNDTLESDDDNFGQPFDDDEEEAPSHSTGPLPTIHYLPHPSGKTLVR